jgi:hypothetical protein
MKRRAVFAQALCIVLFVLLSGGFATATASSGDPAKDAQDLLNFLKNGDFDSFSAGIANRMNAPRGKLDGQIAPWKNLASGIRPVYIDKIRQVDYGTSLKLLIYSIYYGKRNFIFVSLYYARLQEGWRLYDFSYNTNLKKILE